MVTRVPALICVLMLVSNLPARAADEPDIIIADFEGPDYGDWQVTGTAFGSGPAHGTLPDQMPVTGYLGQGLVNSYLGGDRATGTLTSPPFTIQRRYIHFLIGGGKFPGQTCINLVVGHDTVRTATGPNADDDGGSEQLDWQRWDVSEYIGRTARIQIVDEYTGGWGHINVDQIVQSNKEDILGAVLLDDFEDGDLVSKNYCCWAANLWSDKNDGEVLLLETVDANPGGRTPNRVAHARFRTGTGSWANVDVRLILFSGNGNLEQHKPYVDYGYDFRGYEAVRFRLRTSWGGGGDFRLVTGKITDSRQYHYPMNGSPETWRSWTIPLAELKSDERAVTLEQALQHTYAIACTLYAPLGATVDVWIDDVALIPRSGYIAPVLPEPPSGLKEAAHTKDFLVGFSLATYEDERHRAVLERNADFINSGWFGMDGIRASPQDWDFTLPDSMVKWAHDHEKTVMAHCLLYRVETPDWLRQADLAPAEVDALMKEFIQRTIRHYQAAYPHTVTHWCIDNEGIDDATLTHRPGIWYDKLGEEYLDKACRYAHEADPNAKLYYCDYDIAWPSPKTDAVYNLLRRLLDRQVPIHGIALQMRVWNPATFPGKAAVLETLNRFGRLGLEVYPLEMEVVLNTDGRGRTPDKLNRQADIYRQFVEACVDSPYCSRLAICGLSDKYSWIVQRFGRDDWPLLLDEWYQPKPAWYAVMDVLTAPPAVREGFESGDFSKFAWVQEGDAPWLITSDKEHSGLYSARAGALNDAQTSTLKLTRTCSSGKITFWVSVSSMPGRDQLYFLLDNEQLGAWSGEQGWRQVSYAVPAGSHTFAWSYQKNGSDAQGADTAWIDDVVFP